jgi:hypothetical protein
MSRFVQHTNPTLKLYCLMLKFNDISLSGSIKVYSLIQRRPTVCLIACVITETPNGALCVPSW